LNYQWRILADRPARDDGIASRNVGPPVLGMNWDGGAATYSHLVHPRDKHVYAGKPSV